MSDEHGGTTTDAVLSRRPARRHRDRAVPPTGLPGLGVPRPRRRPGRRPGPGRRRAGRQCPRPGGHCPRTVRRRRAR
ncbi:hypothetical protein VM98_19705 [Streptomyces rubellomurinus subsp. indigoferus]|nr:hypothetical protein VM98_19705 [Streptomyces rubellomurinus subsp. indigoferus]